VVINNVSAANLIDGVWALSDANNPLRIAPDLQPISAIYPNPFNDFVKVNIAEHENEVIDYVIYDAMLREVLKGKLLQGESIINTQQLVPGAYVIKANVGGIEKQEKMVKM
jgi:hypothetical protein